MNKITRQEKEAIRNSPCGRCGKVPPFEGGSRCHAHRIMPGSAGGKYTSENTVPRCPSCHDIEHGGTGEAPFIGAAVVGGRKGGLIGGKRVHELHPELASQNGKRTNELHPEAAAAAGRKGGRRTAQLGYAHFVALGKKGGTVGGARTAQRGHEYFVALGKKGGSKGGTATRKRYPNQASSMGKSRWRSMTPEAQKQHCSMMGKLGGKRTSELYAGKCSEWGRVFGQKGGRTTNERHPGWNAKGPHTHWHLNRGIINPNCPYCVEGDL